jgi:DNA replicative helicase MCM subunit Mcm2 (Cdc46/Mcm family)
MTFNCSKCDLKQKLYFQDGKYQTPFSCNTLSCKSKTFTPDLKNTVTIDYQRIKIQEEIKDNTNEAGNKQF